MKYIRKKYLLYVVLCIRDEVVHMIKIGIFASRKMLMEETKGRSRRLHWCPIKNKNLLRLSDETIYDKNYLKGILLQFFKKVLRVALIALLFLS